MSSPTEHRILDTAEARLALEEQQRINCLYQYLVSFEPGSSILPNLPFDVFDREVLFASTSVAGV